MIDVAGCLKNVAPKCDQQLWGKYLDEAMRRYNINTPQRGCAFLAQMAHECHGFTRLEENLRYTKAERLKEVWPSRFATMPPGEIGKYVNNPEALANFVYANRMGNGPPASGDGWRYRGRGPTMLTGLSNYMAAANATGWGLDLKPDSAATPQCGAHIAGWFWSSRGCNELADHPPGADDREDFIKITRLINGGEIGLARRIELWKNLRRFVTV